MITEKIDRITDITPDRLTATPTHPYAAKIELTGKCNFECSFCATPLNLRDKQHMDFDLYKKIALDLKESGVEELGLFYLGESLLYPKIIDAIKYAKDIGFEYVFITTNGSLSNKKMSRKCIEAGLDSLKFSYNWPNAKECKKVTGKNIFNKLIKNIKNTYQIREEIHQSTGQFCGLYASTIVANQQEKDDMIPAVDLIIDYLDEHYWLPKFNQAGHFEEVKFQGNQARLDNMRAAIPCWTLFNKANITFDGHLSACCFDHTHAFDMGSLENQDFLDIWKSEKYQQLRQQHLDNNITNEECRKCLMI